MKTQSQRSACLLSLRSYLRCSEDKTAVLLRFIVIINQSQNLVHIGRRRPHITQHCDMQYNKHLKNRTSNSDK